MVLTERRDAVIADRSSQGRALCSALAAATDDMLVELFETAGGTKARRRGAVALLAVGGYGRGELAPHSDLDVVLIHERRTSGVDELAGAMWYPLWDAGLKLAHAVRSVDDQLTLATEDLDTATAMLTARPLAGDAELAQRVVTEALARWRKHGRWWLDALRAKGLERREQAGDVAYLLEPDLKSGHGGLRDVQSLWWAAAADLLVPADDLSVLDRCYDRLLDVRVALHRVVDRPGDTLRLQDQDAVAAELGCGSADALMADVAAAGRTIVWIADGAWRHHGRHELGREERVAEGVIVSDRAVELEPLADVGEDAPLLWRVARIAAERELPVGRATLDRLAAELDDAAWVDRWPAGALGELVGLLAQGHRAIDVLESLDQKGLLARALPEWAPVRSRPQRNAYHRFTVDRHLWEAAANAAALADRVDRPDLLLLGALFHDLGKGYPGDHTDAGVALIEEVGPRLGLAAEDVATVRTLIQYHLLLPDVAVRRDLHDPATVRAVRDAVGDGPTLRLLHALTEADSLATGPSAWGTWKAQLVSDLVTRTAGMLDGTSEATFASGAGRTFPDDAAVQAMALGETTVEVVADRDAVDGTERITVVTPDRPGTFARVAGALALRGLDVMTAWAASGDYGGGPMAASRFRVIPPRHGDIDWRPVVADVRRAIDGQLAIDARIAERASTYRRRKATQAAPPGPPHVAFHDDASDAATVIEVTAPNAVGVLHRIARSLADLGLDIRHATVQSLGEEVVDTFYVCAVGGGRVTDAFHRREIERALLHALGPSPRK